MRYEKTRYKTFTTYDMGYIYSHQLQQLEHDQDFKVATLFINPNIPRLKVRGKIANA